ncbi:hypothetical protein COL93_14415 [Bacillus toyonensis]|uniref:Uncharacterized protein n=1 Tax=Bacillus toyonensis TaxID=155322 RepID=A0A2C4R0N4_9BACI|nr:hypothetical protein COL93_14415 [Bacillus toyonensis]PHD70946.1 hypothetical protein COF40_09855 [Bacillus toyonensis]
MVIDTFFCFDFFFYYVKKRVPVTEYPFYEPYRYSIIVMCASREQIIVRKVRVQDTICKLVENGTKGQSKYGFKNQKHQKTYILFVLFSKNAEPTW